MGFIFLGVYILIGLVNLMSAAFFWETPRKITKAALMPVLLAFYIFSAGDLIIPVIPALIFSFAGDVLLIKKEDPRFFKLGLAAFLVSHIFYIISFLLLAGILYGQAAGGGVVQPASLPSRNEVTHGIGLIVSIIVGVPLGLLILKLLNPSKVMRIPVTAYAVVIELMSIAALQLMLARFNGPSILIFAGSLGYIFSDSFMAYFSFNGKPKYFNFMTMLPYIIVQGCIVGGLVLS
ncbi:MAG: lysoplasmalogenase [Treponema sp.]|jgi:uncharacterized membrane protein YhhN|nr:lysoplasmalogenase [Treponema sp.]